MLNAIFSAVRTLYLLNIVFFIITTIFVHLQNTVVDAVHIFTSPKFILKRKPAPENPMYYLIAGNLNQASNAFEHLLATIPHNAGITFVDYDYTGYHPEAFARYILSYSSNYSCFNIIAISQGAQPALALASKAQKVYLINPCVQYDFLQPSQKPLAKYLGIYLFSLISALLGFISIIPILAPFKPDWRGYSLSLLINQFMAICYHRPDKPALSNIGVIISDYDEILDNTAIKDYFTGCAEITTIPTAHGDTAHHAEEYRKGLQHIMNAMK